MKVHELMTRQVVTTTPETSLKEVARVMMSQKISGVPVVDGDGHLVGVVSEGDIVHQESIRRPGTSLMSLLRRTEGSALTVAEVMTTKVLTVTADDDHTDAARRMESSGVKRLPVIDEAKKLIGLISRSDLLKAYGRADEDIAAEIESEVIRRILWLDAGRVSVEVGEGKVTLSGKVLTRSDARILEEMTRRIDGVVRVDVSNLEYDVDDSRRSDSPMSGGRPAAHR
jgi:CBS domain-containing protein